MNTLLRSFAAGLMAVGAAFLVAGPTAAADSVTLKIGFPPGGGFDLIGRLLARHIGRHLPGNPDIVVQNVPGGGSLKLTELLQAGEPTDGSMFAMINSSISTAPLLDPSLERLKPLTYPWVGSLSNQSSLCFTGKDAKITTFEDFRDKDFILGATDKSSTTYTFAALVKNVIGAKFRIVTGFEGSNDIEAAIVRGEVQARCSASYSTIVAKGQLDSVDLQVQLGFNLDDRTASVPNLADLATSKVDSEAVGIITGSLRFHHPFTLPPGTPQDVVDTYRAAFDATIADPEFLADAKTMKVDLSPTPGVQITDLVKALYDNSPAAAERARELLN